MTRPAALALATALGLAACASFSPDGGMDRVADLTKQRTGYAPQRAGATSARIDELLGQPLTPDAAVELALLNNRGLQARLAGLGLAEADLVQAGRLRAPRWGFGRLAGGGIVEIERSIVFDVLGWLTMPSMHALEQQRFERAQFDAARDAVLLAANTRSAYMDAVAAKQLAAYFEQVKEAADASHELAQRMAQLGNFSALARMREQAYAADALTDLSRARQQTITARERLTRLLGLPGERAGFVLPERLPDLPAQPADPRYTERIAIDRRLDMMIARHDVEASARSLGLTRITRYVDVFELSLRNRDETASPRANGGDVELSLPIFDFGSVANARAESIYMQAVHRAAETALNARSQVRETHAAYRTAYELARYYRDEIVPLRKRISDENLLRYNGMLISVFDLLADSREQVRAVAGYVQALRDFWIADTQLQTAMTAGSAAEPP